MLTAILVVLRSIALVCGGHRAVAVENLVLRQQLAVLTRTNARTCAGRIVPAAVVSFSGPSPALTTGTANTTTKKGVITVTNSGTLNLNLTANPTIFKTAGLGTFSILTGSAGGTCVSGAAVASGGGTCTINVRYVPSGTATSTANVTLTDTGAQTATQTSPNFNGN